MATLCVFKQTITGLRTSELRMPEQHAGREGTSEEEREEKEEKGRTT